MAANQELRTADPGYDPWQVPLDEPADADPASGKPAGKQQRHPVVPSSRVRRAPYQLKTRKARPGCSWPYVIVAGGDYSGKTFELIRLAQSGRFGRVWWLPIGEDPDMYAELLNTVGAGVDIVEHDGSYYEIYSAVKAIHAEATAAVARGEKPHLVAVDSGSNLWALLSAIAEGRALKSDEAREALLRNPFADVTIGTLHWNAVNSMWRKIETLLYTMPAVVVMTARAKENVAIVNGKPNNNLPKVFKPQLANQAEYASTLYVRLDRERAPQILGARMAVGGVRPGIDPPLVFDGQNREGGRAALPPFSLEWCIFHAMKFDPETARVRDIVEIRPDADGSEPVSAPPAPPAGADEPAGAGPSTADITPEAAR